MHRDLFLVALLLFQVAPFRLIAQNQMGADKPPSSEQLSLRGRITDVAGSPLPGVTVQLSSGASKAAYKVVSDGDGTYYFPDLSVVGEVLLLFSKEACETVARKLRSPEELKAQISLDISIVCCDPGLPIPPHSKARPVSPDHYVGQYEVQTVCKNSHSTDNVVQLLEGNAAVLISKDGARSDVCWRVKEDGDIEVWFSCKGLAFAGRLWTLWKKGNDLIGYSSGWTDCGCNPPICELTLTPTKTGAVARPAER